MAEDLAVAQAHAQWWSPDLKSKMDASPSAAAEGADGADESNRILGHELTPEEEDVRAELETPGTSRELTAWGKFGVFSLHEDGGAPKQIVQTRWVLT